MCTSVCQTLGKKIYEGIADADKLQKTLQRSFKRTYTFFISTTIFTDERSDGYD
ncbi:unnamed protein product [Brassica oleracea var. botrytis]|uniref:(rape) hypothetical protein n=1 Tax=Brassica napus TaxID=3708 RepID=A0A816JN79_BRANA|nr:unnamed protein product [Brassica napus]